MKEQEEERERGKSEGEEAEESLIFLERRGKAGGTEAKEEGRNVGARDELCVYSDTPALVNSWQTLDCSIHDNAVPPPLLHDSCATRLMRVPSPAADTFVIQISKH